MTIKEIEKTLMQLALRERALGEERDRARGRLLYNAEKHPSVNRVIEDVFVSALGFDRNSVDRYSQQGRSAGEGGSERLSEVIVFLSVSSRGDSPLEDCAEVSVRLRLNGGFDDRDARLSEKSLGDEISALRAEIARLRAMKRALRDR
ncbi:MAG TPA: hypothetical protein VLM75_03920 [Spirochaetota bacterium]|nr:hypothetical protein [Spirochaetota bacterium]